MNTLRATVLCSCHAYGHGFVLMSRLSHAYLTLLSRFCHDFVKLTLTDTGWVFTLTDWVFAFTGWEFTQDVRPLRGGERDAAAEGALVSREAPVDGGPLLRGGRRRGRRL